MCSLYRTAPPEGGQICHRCVVQTEERRVKNRAPLPPSLSPPTFVLPMRQTGEMDGHDLNIPTSTSFRPSLHVSPHELNLTQPLETGADNDAYTQLAKYRTQTARSKAHVLDVLRLRHVSLPRCDHCKILMLVHEIDHKHKYVACCGKGSRMHPPWTPPPVDLIAIFETRGWSAISRIVNSLFTTTVLHSKDKGIWYHVGCGAPAMRVQGHLYSRVMRTTANFWFVADAKYGQGYKDLSDAQKQLVHRFHRILLRDSRMVHASPDFSNMPTITEVSKGDIIVSASEKYLSAVFLGQSGSCVIPPERCITQISAIQSPRTGVVLGSRQALNEQSKYWEPLMYTVYNIHGELRFQKGLTFPVIRSQTCRGMTMLGYLKSVILHERFFWHSSRLAQQYLLDMWCRNESTNIKFLTSEAFQRTIRAQLRSVNGREVLPGKVFMPSSYPGSFRHSQANYHDALHISTQEGPSHLFLTMTANPHWPEIIALLPEGQTASDRPDIIARVFSVKISELLEKLRTPGYLCPSHLGTQWVVYAVEWQQGGLPHIHLAIRLIIDEQITPMLTIHDQLKFMKTIISAKVPHPSSPVYHLVNAFMIHGHPCKHCVRKRRHGGEGCRFFFPKPLSASTRIDQRGFPIYERDECDRWVVPHNLRLLEDFFCHINVEWTFHSQCLAYCFKYTFKGIDASGVKIRNELDEIAAFRRARVLSVSEVIWRVLGNDVYHKKPCVILCKFRLPHFPGTSGSDAVVDIVDGAVQSAENGDVQRDFSDNELDLEAALHDDDEFHAGSISTDHLTRYFMRERDLLLTFTEFFRWWQKVTFSEQLLTRTDVEVYVDFAGSMWRKRESPCLARMKWWPATAGEIHFLRLLLLHAPARSYDDLLRGFKTFRESAIDAGLVPTDKESIYVLRDAIAHGYPGTTLRRLFTSLMFHSSGMYDAWNDLQIRHAICLDFVPSEARSLQWDQRLAPTLALIDICVIVRSMDRDDIHTRMHYYGLPSVPTTLDEVVALSTQLPHGFALLSDFCAIIGIDLPRKTRERDHQSEIKFFRSNAQKEFTDAELAQRVTSLNVDQNVVFQRVMAAVDHEQVLLAIDAPAGSGKTYLCRTLAAFLRQRNHIVLCCATTGIAALQYFNGRTAHSLFFLPLDRDRDVLDGDQLRSKLFDVLGRVKNNTNGRIELLRACWGFIWDEISMANKYVFDAVDTVSRAIMGNDLPFGGKACITLGDTRQCAPICEENASRAIDVDYAVFATSTFQISIFASKTWSRFEKISLQINERGKNRDGSINEDGRNFHAQLMKIGNGELLEMTVFDVATTFPGIGIVRSTETACEWLFDTDESRDSFNPDMCSRRCFIAPFNSEVNATNDFICRELQRLRVCHSMRRLLSVDTFNSHDGDVAEMPHIPVEVTDDDDVRINQQHLIDVELMYADTQHDDDNNIPFGDPGFVHTSGGPALDVEDVTTELLHGLNFSGVPPHALELCEGMVVIVTRNLDSYRGVMNGTRMVVSDISKRGRLITLRHPLHSERKDREEPFLCHRIDFICKIGSFGATMRRKQFPLRCGYAATIHKAQSLTLERVVVDLRSGVFDHGQLYVALSRVRSPYDLCILLRPDQESIRNVVFEVLLMAAGIKR